MVSKWRQEWGFWPGKKQNDDDSQEQCVIYLLSISLVVLRKGMQSDKSRGHTGSEEHRRKGDRELHCCRFCLLAFYLCGHKRFAFQRIVRKGEDVLMVGVTIIHKRRFLTYVKMHQSYRIVVGSTAHRLWAISDFLDSSWFRVRLSRFDSKRPRLHSILELKFHEKHRV